MIHDHSNNHCSILFFFYLTVFFVITDVPRPYWLLLLRSKSDVCGATNTNCHVNIALQSPCYISSNLTFYHTKYDKKNIVLCGYIELVFTNTIKAGILQLLSGRRCIVGFHCWIFIPGGPVSP